MTLQVNASGPGDSSYTSPSYTATIEGSGTFVYSYARTAFARTRDYNTNELVRACWIKYGADQAAEIVISHLSNSITEFDIVPRNVPTSAAIVDGDLILTVPPNTNLRIIINGVTNNPLHIFSTILKAPVPGAIQNWENTGLSIDAINYDENEITFSTDHNLNTNDRIVFKEEIGRSATEFTELGIAQYEPYLVEVTSPSRIGIRPLGTLEGSELVDLTDGGTSLGFKAYKASYSNSASALYFPSGVHVVGRTFTLAPSCTVYLDEGAVVIGGFDIRNIGGVSFSGPGLISGEHTPFESISAMGWYERILYSPICGFDDVDGYHPNSIQGVTMLASPFWTVAGGMWSARDIQIINGWTPNTDAIEVGPRSFSDFRSEVIRVFSWSGDDNVRISSWCNHTVSSCLLVNSYGANLHGLYYAVNPSQLNTITVRDINLVNLTFSGNPVLALGEGYGTNGFLIRSWTDGWASATNYGHYNVSISGVNVWGEVGCRAFSFENKSYPWGVTEPGSPDLSRDQHGQIAYWSIKDMTFEHVPAEISRIIGYDETNTPHDIEFENIDFAGTLLTSDNNETYFLINGFPYNILFQEVEVEIPEYGPADFGCRGRNFSESPPTLRPRYCPETRIPLTKKELSTLFRFFNDISGKNSNPGLASRDSSITSSIMESEGGSRSDGRYKARWQYPASYFTPVATPLVISVLTFDL